MSVTSLLGIVASCVSVLAFLPQVVKAWRTRSTGDVSLGTFTLIAAGALLWIAYGWLRQDWPVLATNAVILMLAVTMIVLKQRHG